MTLQADTQGTGGFLVSEGNGQISRDAIIIEGGSGAARDIKDGTILGKLTAGEHVAYDHGASDGSETPVGILMGDVSAPDGVDTPAVMVSRLAEVNEAETTWPAGIPLPTRTNAKATLAGDLLIFR